MKLCGNKLAENSMLQQTCINQNSFFFNNKNLGDFQG